MSSPSTADANASGAPRRVSGRVRKQPDIYAAGDKRKRSTAMNDDEDAEMLDEHDSDDDVPTEDDDPDEEEVREQSRRVRKPKGADSKRPAQKRVKINGASLPIRTNQGATKKAPRKRRAPNNLDVTDAEGVFARVFASADNVDDIAGQWIQDFKVHESRALADIINFVLKCAGCNIKVAEEDIEDPDGVSNRLTDIQEEFQASGPTDYPLIARGRAGVSFRETMNHFLRALIRSISATDLLFDNTALIENIQVWFSTMSSAANRAFRHTSTVASLCVISALCEIGHDSAQELAAKQRQAENERKKARPNKSRVKDMEERASETGKVVEFIEIQLRDWFDVVFIHRYRDVDPVIRRDCITALGDWIVAMPEVFFDGQHLRYLGWVLSDTAATTRGEVIKQLQRLYKEKSMIGGLKTFTERFRTRLVEIATSDAETSVRSAGIELLDLLRENGLLEPDDVDAVGRLLYDSDPKVRKSVSSFFAENVADLYDAKIDELGGIEKLDEALPELGEDNYDSPRLAWIKYKCLAEMMVAYDTGEAQWNQSEGIRGDEPLTLHAAGIESRFTLAADVLYNKIDEIEDWQALSGYLLFDHSRRRSAGGADRALTQMKKECALNNVEEVVLLHVVSASVKRAVLDLGEKSSTAKAKLTKKQKEQLTEEQEEVARHLAGLIPKLLKKFGDSPGTAAAVLKMENVLNLPSLKDLPQDSATYGALLDDIRKQFMSHGTDDVLAPATDAILHAKSYGELDDVTEEKLSSLWEDVLNNLAQLINPKTVSLRAASESEELSALSNNLLRITRLSQVSNCIAPLEDGAIAKSKQASGAEFQGAIDYIIAFVQRALPNNGPVMTDEDAVTEDKIAARASEAALRYMQWKFSQIKDTVMAATESEIPFAELEALATRRDTYFSNMLAVLDARKAGDEICTALTTLLLDLSASAKILKTIKPKDGVSTDYEALVVDLHPSCLKSIMNVFSATERSFAKFNGKRLDGPSATDSDADITAEPLDDDDPLSDLEDELEENGESEELTQHKERRLRQTLLAERRLCELTRSIIFAVHAGVIDARVARRRLERNKTKLGPNFKEIVAYLDIGRLARPGSKSKGKSKGGKTNGAHPSAAGRVQTSKHYKSNAIVADDEEDDEIEDGDGEGQSADENDAEQGHDDEQGSVLGE